MELLTLLLIYLGRFQVTNVADLLSQHHFQTFWAGNLQSLCGSRPSPILIIVKVIPIGRVARD